MHMYGSIFFCRNGRVVQSVQIHHHEYMEYFMLVQAHGHFGRNNRWKMWKKEGIF